MCAFARPPISLFAIFILIAASAASGLASEHQYPLKVDPGLMLTVKCKEDFLSPFCSHVDASIAFSWFLALVFLIAPARFLYPIIKEGTTNLHYRDETGPNTQWAPV